MTRPTDFNRGLDTDDPIYTLRDLVLRCNRSSRVFPEIAIGPTANEWFEMLRLAKQSKAIEEVDIGRGREEKKDYD